MNLRRPFPSVEARGTSITAVQDVCRRWEETLAPHLRFNDSTASNMIVLAIHATFYCCVALLHLPTATEAIQAGKTIADDPSLQRLLISSRYWAKMVGRQPFKSLYLYRVTDLS